MANWGDVRRAYMPLLNWTWELKATFFLFGSVFAALAVLAFPLGTKKQKIIIASIAFIASCVIAIPTVKNQWIKDRARIALSPAGGVGGASNIITSYNQTGGFTGINNGVVNQSSSPRKGLRLLETAYDADSGVTTFKFGSEAEEKIGRYSISMFFLHPYDKVERVWEAGPFFDIHDGFDGETPGQNSDRLSYTVSGAGISEPLLLKFTAPYEMELKQLSGALPQDDSPN